MPWVFAPTRTRLVIAAAAAVGLALALWSWQRRAEPVRTPSTIASLPRQDTGHWFDIAQRARDGAAQDPRLGRTVAAAYGSTSLPTPALGVLSAVIKVGHGPEIVSSLVGALGGDVALGPLVPAPAGKHGGTLECGTASYGAIAGTYCVWWDSTVVGVAVIADPDNGAAAALALKARNATQR